MRRKILDLLAQIKAFEKDPGSFLALPDHTYYLNDDSILSCKREYGISRYPYEQDGLTLWVSDNGHITANESELTIFRPSYTDEMPCMAFYMGIKQPDGTYLPVSAAQATAQLWEPANIKRYTVFAPAAAYYITFCADWAFCVRVFVDKEKKSHFTLGAVNFSQKPMDIYFASCFEALLRYEEAETRWNKKSRQGQKLENGNIVLTTDHLLTNCLSVNYTRDPQAGQIFTSVSSFDFLESYGSGLANAGSLKRGKFKKCDRICAYASLPVAADITHYTLQPDNFKMMDIGFTLSYDRAEAIWVASENRDVADLTAQVAQKEAKLCASLQPLSMEFSDWSAGETNPAVLNRFLKNVQRQVDICAFGKSYAGPRLGVRDVFQQLEAAVLWAPEAVRQRIVEIFNYIDPSGRAPRQITIPPTDRIMPNIDIRPFIDQGFWMIDAVYTYLCYTGDYSILDEQCGYCILPDEPNLILSRCEAPCDEKDSLLVHMLRIIGYLESNLDTEYGTDCLRVLFGDWNDALDGLGKAIDPQQRFGSGVTVMGTLQFYRDLERMRQILGHIGGYESTVDHYQHLRDRIEAGFRKFAVQTDGDGNQRIVHGWGDRLSYFVGSFRDTDGADRISFAPNAFYALSGMMVADPSLRSTATDALKSLDSKYGLKTLSPAFTPDTTGVGRIAFTRPGTAENCCAYAHASLFSICALFTMGESEFAWKQLDKTMVISHENPSLSTFAMPNSYLENAEYGYDGESAGDWYTGAGAVLIKGLVKHGFGIMPDLSGLTIALPKSMPCKRCSIKLTVRGCQLTLKYQNVGSGHRSYLVNGDKFGGFKNELTGSEFICLNNEDLKNNLTVVITD